MRLDRVQIKNFRSIQDQTITFDHRCRILVGINESGKSNVLKAHSMLSPDVEPSEEDLREVSPGEDAVEDSHVIFVFTLEDHEIKKVFEGVAEKVLTKHKAPTLVTYGGKGYSLRELCTERNEGLYKVDVKGETKGFSYWRLSADWALHRRWKKASSDLGASKDFVNVSLNDGRTIALKDFALIDAESYPEIPSDVLDDVDVEDVNALVAVEVRAIVESALPGCVFWTYDDDNLLPARINQAKFVQNPDSCHPLKNMFRLAGITDIQEALASAQKKSTHGVRNLLNLVAKTSTKHIHSIWSEYKDVSISLAPYGPTEIDAGIKDTHNLFEMSRRSDGFKRFVSFLLMVSAQVRTKQLTNTLLLIDEPDNSLHPSGARYLREELIAISKNNYVVYSTHSIFMIDRDNIGRHLITTKKNEVTKLKEANESNVVDEEVLYNSLGHSVFENIKKRNIVFEGWRDKELFEVAISKLPPKYNDLKGEFKEIGSCYAHGVRDIRYITPMIELANCECFIISDDDEISKEKQKEYIKNKGYGTWKRYSEIQSGTTAITGEDFLVAEAILAAWKKVKNSRSGLPELAEKDMNGVKGRIYAISSLLQKSGFQAEAKKIIDELKEELFRDLKPSHIDLSYHEFLVQFSNLLRGHRGSAR